VEDALCSDIGFPIL